jgi:soluble lytic murein transglycosylase-like protein
MAGIYATDVEEDASEPRRPIDSGNTGAKPVGVYPDDGPARDGVLTTAPPRRSAQPESTSLFEDDAQFQDMILDAPKSPFTSAPAPQTLNVHHWAPPKKSAPYIDKVREVEELHEMPTNLMAALVTQESQWNPKAESSAGARGLTQIMPQHHPGVDADDPDIAIEYGADYLSKLKNLFGTWELALAAYNWGPSNLKTHGIENAPKETRDYIKRIMGKIHLGPEE